MLLLQLAESITLREFGGLRSAAETHNEDSGKEELVFLVITQAIALLALIYRNSLQTHQICINKMRILTGVLTKQ
ncbi:hypothetical protein Clacol_000283 [Clathrus columnatus]|uniref:Uncharacterized protein n=1 Tax=Clathrus columnatus TaxID=1419009 RepID=A0AAV4ZYQ1_9AGAM|nr:hypothetical protein Clacol_000283 [Clathrus columnatus]